MMNISRAVTLLVVFASLGSNVISVRNLEESRSIISVEYDYKIEVNRTVNLNSVEDGISILEEATMDEILEILGEDSSVKISQIRSVPEGECMDEVITSDVCSLVKSTIDIEMDKAKNELITRYATLEEIEAFLRRFNAEEPSIQVSFRGPFVRSTDVIIRLDGVSRRMNDDEIAIFERALVDVLDPLAEGVRVTSATVFFQRFRNGLRRRLQAATGFNLVYTSIKGTCGDCSRDRYTELVDDGIGSRKRKLQQILRDTRAPTTSSTGSSGSSSNTMNGESPNNTGNNGSNSNNNETVIDENGKDETAIDNGYFGEIQVEATKNVVPTTPSFTDLTSLKSRSEFPYWFLIALGAGMGIISTGIIYIGCRARQNRLEMLAVHRESMIREQKLQQSKRLRSSMLGTDVLDDDDEE